MTTSNSSLMSIELPPGQDDDFFKTSTNASRIFTYDNLPCPPMKPNPSVHPTQKENAPAKEINKLPAWSTATSKLTEIEVQQQHEIARLTEEQAQTAQVTRKANQIIEAQRAEIKELKAQQTVDNEKPSKEALEAKTAQCKEATHLRKELQEEMKSMMQQFMESFKVPLEAKTPESNKRQINTTEAANDNPRVRSDETIAQLRLSCSLKIWILEIQRGIWTQALRTNQMTRIMSYEASEEPMISQSHSSTSLIQLLITILTIWFLFPQTRHITRPPEMYYQSKFLQGSTHILMLTLRIQIQRR